MTPGGPQIPQIQALQAGKGLLGKLRGLFSRGGGAQAGAEAAAGVAAAQSAEVAHVATNTVKKGVVTSGVIGTTNALGKTHGKISKFNQFTFYTSMLAGGIATVAGVFGGRKTEDGAIEGKNALGRGLMRASGAVALPGEKMKTTSMRQVGRAGSSVLGRVGEVAGRRLGEDSSKVVAIRNATTRMAALEGSAWERAKKAAYRASTPIGNAIENRGGDLLKTLAGRSSRGAGHKYDDAQQALASAMTAAESSGALSGVAKALEAAKTAMGGKASEMDSDAINTAVEGVQEALKKAGDAVDKRTLGSLQKSVGAFTETASAAQHKVAVADKISDFPDAVRQAPNKFANASVANVALKGAIVTGTALQVTSTARGVAEEVHTLKQVYADMTGDQKISTYKILFGKNVPDVVKQARKHIIKEYGPRTLLNLANVVATYTFMKNNSFKSMAGSIGLQGLSTLHNTTVQGKAILPLYADLHTRPEITTDQYAAFISASSEDARNAGGPMSPLVQALAQEYARENVRPAEILKEIETGRFDERAVDLVQRQQASASNGLDAAAVTPSEMVSRPGAVAGGGRAVVGPHTQRLQQGQASGLGPIMPGR